MEQFLSWEFTPQLRELETTIFVWSGFAIWVGIIARVPLRSRALRSPWLTLVLGFIGICLGPFLTRSFFQLEQFDPLGPAGIVSSVVVAILAITFFHVFSFLAPRNEYDDDYYEDDDRNGGRNGYDYDKPNRQSYEYEDQPERRYSSPVRRPKGFRKN